MRSALILFLFVFGKFHCGIRLVMYSFVEGNWSVAVGSLEYLVRIHDKKDDGNVIVEENLVRSYLMYRY